MALKKKLTKAEFEKLSEHFKTEYKAEGDSYVLDVDGEEDIEALKRAHERSKEEKKEAKRLLKEAQDKLDALEEGDHKNKGNVEALENSYKKKISDNETAYKTEKDKLTKALVKTVVGGQAQKLATELAGKNSKLLIPFLESRFQADLDGDEPKLKILDRDGKPSAFTLDDLKKEFVDNADFSAIIVGSKATGGAGGDKTKNNGGAGSDNKPLDLSKASPEALVAHLKASKAE